MAKDSKSFIQTEVGNINGKANINRSAREATNYRTSIEDLDWMDLDYGENAPLGRNSSGAAESEDPELEEILSD